MKLKKYISGCFIIQFRHPVYMWYEFLYDIIMIFGMMLAHIWGEGVELEGAGVFTNSLK